MTDAIDLIRANREAQMAFHEMISKVYHVPTEDEPTRTVPAYSITDAPETLAYVAAERAVDELLVNLQWEKAKAEL